MVQEQVLQGPLHQSRIQGLPHFQQNSLVPVVRVRKVLFEEPVLDGSQRYRAGHQTLFGLDGRGCAGRRQLGDRLVLKQLFGGEAEARLIGSGDDLDAEDRVPAQLEEVVVDADPFEPQHFGPDLCQPLLGRSARGCKALFSSGRAWSGAGSARRSTLPLGVNGSASSTTKAAGTM